MATIQLSYITLADAKQYLRISDAIDDAVLQEMVDAAMTQQFARCSVAMTAAADDPLADPIVVSSVDHDLQLGALMRVARLYARRASPEGIIPLGDIGVARVPRYDADIDALEARWRDVVLA